MAYIPPRRAPEPEMRLLLLYTMDKLGVCTDLQLLQFLFEYDLMNYFDLTLTLADLCDQGHAVRTPYPSHSLYRLTAAGQEALKMFYARIPLSVRQTVDDHAPLWQERIAQEQQYLSAYNQTDRGEFALELQVMEQNMEMMKISLSLPGADVAAQMRKNWPSKAAEIYQTIISLLAEGD